MQSRTPGAVHDSAQSNCARIIAQLNPKRASGTVGSANPALLCALYGGIQFVWGAVLAVSLQARSIALGGHAAVLAYATIAAAGAGVATIVQIAAGILSDRRYARDTFYAAGIGLALPAIVWFYLAPALPQLAAAFFSLQFAVNVAGGPYAAVIPDYVERPRRGRASSFMSAYSSLGNAAGLIVAGFVHDLRAVAAFLCSGLAATYAITAIHLRSRNRDTKPGGLRTGVSPEGSRVRAIMEALLLSRGLVNVGFFTLVGFLLFYVRDALGIVGSAAEVQTALIFLTFTLTAVTGAILAARPADRYDKRRVVCVAIAVIALALGALASAPSIEVAYAAAALAGCAWGAFVTTDWALATALLPQGSMATAMGVWNIATALPQVIAPLIAAPLVVRLDRLHVGLGPRAAIVLALVEFIAGGAAIWRLPRC